MCWHFRCLQVGLIMFTFLVKKMQLNRPRKDPEKRCCERRAVQRRHLLFEDPSPLDSSRGRRRQTNEKILQTGPATPSARRVDVRRAQGSSQNEKRCCSKCCTSHDPAWTRVRCTPARQIVSVFWTESGGLEPLVSAPQLAGQLRKSSRGCACGAA
jgi:hypothetical protein